MLTTRGFNYHEDHGEGGDFYKVGNTLGCGGAAPVMGGKVCLPSKNFSQWKILANGPIRSVFELTYDTWKAGSMMVRETKRISIDLGSNLNEVKCFYASDDAETIPVAAGIVLHDSSNQTFKEKNIIGYWLPADGENGKIGCGVVYGADMKAKTGKVHGHLLMQVMHKTDAPFVYYAGSCWNKNTDFKTFDQWQQYLKAFKECVDNPVIVRFSDSNRS